MNRDDSSRVACAAVLGVIGAVVITKPELSGGAGFNQGMLRWLVYVITCGLIINTQEGKSLWVLIGAAAASGLTLVLSVSWSILLRGGVNLSGVTIDFTNNRDLTEVLLILLFVSTLVGVVVACYSRPVVLDLFQRALHIEPGTAERAEKIINAVARVAGALAMLLFSLT